MSNTIIYGQQKRKSGPRKIDDSIFKAFDDINIAMSLTMGVFAGGPGSGNFGHAGRPGERGGSAPAGATKGVVSGTFKNEGATVHLETGEQPTTGYMIGAGAPTKWINAAEDTPEARSALAKAIKQYKKDNAELLKDPKNFLGTWWDKENGQISLDVSIRETDKAAAIKLGQERNERAIYDLAKGESIDTGGKGNNLDE